MDSFVDLQQQRYLPPDGTAASLLDARFLVADTPDEAELLVSDLEPGSDAVQCPAVFPLPMLTLSCTPNGAANEAGSGSALRTS